MNKVHFAQIEPTTKCNFRCKFCCGRAMDQSDLSFQLFEQFLDMFPELQHIQLQGEGEPLLNVEFFKMVACARDRNINVSFITNGSFFTLANVEHILDNRIRAIRVSLETAMPLRFHEIRGWSLAKIEAGISLLLSERAKRGMETPSLGFALTVLSSTLDDVPSVLNLYQRLGMDGGIAVQTLSTEPYHSSVYDDAMRTEFLNDEQRERLHHYMSGSITREIQNRSSIHLHFYDELFPPRPSRVKERILMSCPWLERGLNMDRHGRITPCCPVKAERWSFGSIENLDRGNLLHARAAIASELKEGRIPTPCQGCRFANIIVAGPSS